MAKKRTTGKRKSDDSAPTEETTSFETALAEVEQIVRELESGELALGESLKQYERGVSRLRQCHEHLRDAQRRVEVLVGFDETGTPVTQPLDGDATTLEEKQAIRSRRRGAADPPSAEGGADTAAEMDDFPGLF